MEEHVLKKTAAGNYTAESVKKYVKTLKELYDKDFAEQKNRMIALRDENRSLKEELNAFRAKERSIAAAVVAAEQIAQGILDEANVQASKRIREADEFEHRTKRLIDSYMERLYGIEKGISDLLNEIVGTAASLQEGGYAPEKAAMKTRRRYTT